MTDPNKSYDAGRLGNPMPPGGDANSWQVGWGAGQRLRDYNASQGAVPGWGAPASPSTDFLPKPYAPGVWKPIGSLQEVLRFNPKSVALALIVLAIPFHRYTIPLWAALYPAAAAVTAGATWVAYHAAVTGTIRSDPLLVGGGVLLGTAWLTTLMDVRLARGARTYRVGRHLVRLGLTFLWGLYALTLYEHITPVRGLALQIPPRLDLSMENVAIALVAVAVMHVWLLGKRPW